MGISTVLENVIPRFVNMKTATALLVLGLITLTGCGPNSEAVALEVAQDWASDSVTSAASNISDALLQDQPILEAIAASVVEDQIRSNVSWNFSSPRQLNGSRYEVMATANSSVTISIPILGDKTFDISGSFVLEIDTEREQVQSSRLDVSSLSIQER